jgi:hypothetical protein
MIRAMPADHRKIAQYFNDEADRLDAEAKDHLDLAVIYRANPTPEERKLPMSGRTAGHCDYFAKVAREAALKLSKPSTRSSLAPGSRHG